jgi:hypothetical protein
MIVLALVVLLTGLALAYFRRTTTDRQLAQTSYNDTSADFLARSALDVVVNDFKQEILNGGTVRRSNIQPQRSGDNAAIPNLIRRSIRNDPIPAPGVSSLASAVSSGPVDPTNVKRGEITSARWNSHYLIPRATPGSGQTWDTVYTDPVPSFTPPDWVLVTAKGPNTTPALGTVIGRYAFAVYDEGGLLDMNVAGYPNWPNTTTCATTPSPTPWLVNVGRKGTVGFADLRVLLTFPTPTTTPNVDNIVGWRNYAMTQRTGSNFGNFNFSTEKDCIGLGKQDFYGSYLLYFGDPPFIIDSVADKLTASLYPFTAVATQPDLSNTRTDQRLTTRQQLLRLQRALDNPVGQFSQNLLQYMGTFSRERNWPAPDWPGLNGSLNAGRYNLNNLGLVIPNPADCFLAHGRKVGWQTGKNKNHLCGNAPEINELFGLFWVKAEVISSSRKFPGQWRYIGNVSSLPDPDASPTPRPGIACLRGANRQNDFFQVLNFALFGNQCAPGPDANVDKVFGIGASLIDQYDSGGDCTGVPLNWGPGCDLDSHVVTSGGNEQYATHTTVILYGRGNGNNTTAYGMEPENSTDSVNGDCNAGDNSHGCNNAPHRPSPAPTPSSGLSNPTIVESNGFSSVGELGYGIDTSTAVLPTLDFWDPNPTPAPTATPYPYAPLLDFFSYNPISSAYPRAGIINLYTKNAPVIAALLSQTLQTNAAGRVTPTPSPAISAADAMTAANAIVTETQRVLAGTASNLGQVDLTRAIAGRLGNAAFTAVPGLATSNETKNAVVRALAEVGQTRTWNLFIDVIAQTGQYAPDATDVTQFIVQGEKRYWLHIALGRDLIHSDGTPCQLGDTGCQVDVLGSQLEEVTE